MKDLDYIKHPTTVKVLIQELKRICDNYIGRKVNEEELRYYIQYWAAHEGALLFSGHESFNHTVVQRIGSKRLKLVQKMLDGYQYTL